MLAYEEITRLKHRLEQENLYLQEESRADAAFADVIGESPAIQRVLASVRLVAGTDSTVLVTGETGPQGSRRPRDPRLEREEEQDPRQGQLRRPSERVIESELFGHEKVPSRAL
jgi:transcriptional regulator with GAF, ATPase, and Fis domain